MTYQKTKYTADYNQGRIEEVEGTKSEFLKIVADLEVWLEVNGLDRAEDDRAVFDPEYQTADMRSEILGALDNEIELIREDIPSNYTDL